MSKLYQVEDGNNAPHHTWLLPVLYVRNRAIIGLLNSHALVIKAQFVATTQRQVRYQQIRRPADRARDLALPSPYISKVLFDRLGCPPTVVILIGLRADIYYVTVVPVIESDITGGDLWVPLFHGTDSAVHIKDGNVAP